MEVYMRSHSVFVAILTAVLGLTAIGTAQASSYSSRAERWEFTVQARYLNAQSIHFNGGSEIDTNSDMGWGFGIGYNFDDHLGMSVDFGWNSPSYDAKIASADTPGTFRRESSELSTSSIQLNLHYYFITGPVTPYVSAGLGSTFIDSNIANGSATGACWWDPYWGYTCSSYQPTYSTNLFSYNGAVGIRWDISREVFLRAAIGKQWINWDNGGSNDAFTATRLEIGFSY